MRKPVHDAPKPVSNPVPPRSALRTDRDRSPERLGLVGEVRRIVAGALEDLPVQQLVIRVVQPGRTRMVLAHVVLPENFTPGNLSELDQIRSKVEASQKAQHLTTVVDVVFTADRHWCALSNDETHRPS